MKKKARKKKAPGPAKPQPPKIQLAPDTQEADNQLDFGGLPDRDLKKNLGCG
jgi:hypothetical protein